MSINGIMLSDYRPEKINNLTESIWVQGGVIPRGKRVVVGVNRDGWQEITFTMGKRQEFVGMALVPPQLIQLEAAPPKGFGAMKLQTIYVDGILTSTDPSRNMWTGTLAGKQVIAQLTGLVYNELQSPRGPVGVRGWVTDYGTMWQGTVTVRIGQHTNVQQTLTATPQFGESTAYAPLPKPQVPPLSIPKCSPGQTVWARYKNGHVEQLDADFYDVLQNNPDLRASIKELFCQGDASAPMPHHMPVRQAPIAQSGAQSRTAMPRGSPRMGPATPVSMPGGPQGWRPPLMMPGIIRGRRGGLRGLEEGTGKWAQGRRAQRPYISGREVNFGALTQNGQPLDGLVTIEDQSRGVKSFTVSLTDADADWLNYIRTNRDILLGLHGHVTLTGNRFKGTVRVTVGQKTSLGYAVVSGELTSESSTYAPPRGVIDQNAPLPPASPESTPLPGTTRMGPATPVSMPGGPQGWRPPSMMPGIMRGRRGGLRGLEEGTGKWAQGRPSLCPPGQVWAWNPEKQEWYCATPPPTAPSLTAFSGIAPSEGFGAAGASEFTVKAAEELDEHLTTNGCAGCDDYKSTLRQLAFKFKAACMTDPAISGQVSFNTSTPLAMTAFGTGTSKALSLVLGPKRTYEGGPCTDDAGACLGNLPQIAQVTPVALGPLIEQVMSQVTGQIQQHQASPIATQLARQENLVNALMAAVVGLLTAISAALSKIVPVSQPQPPAPAPKPPEKRSMWMTFLVGGLIGAAVLGGGALIYTQTRKRAFA